MSSTRPIWKERQRRSSFQPRVAPMALPWVSRTEFCNPERVESNPLTVLIQPLQGCFPIRLHTQGRRSCLAPTLGCMTERRWRSGGENNAAWQSHNRNGARVCEPQRPGTGRRLRDFPSPLGWMTERQRRSSFQPRVAPQALPWVSCPEFRNPERVESLSLTALIQPLQGCFHDGLPPQGRRSCLAPTLGCMMERRWRSGSENNAKRVNLNRARKANAEEFRLHTISCQTY